MVAAVVSEEKAGAVNKCKQSDCRYYLVPEKGIK